MKYLLKHNEEFSGDITIEKENTNISLIDLYQNDVEFLEELVKYANIGALMEEEVDELSDLLDEEDDPNAFWDLSDDNE